MLLSSKGIKCLRQKTGISRKYTTVMNTFVNRVPQWWISGKDEKVFHDSKKFVTQRRENEANSLHLCLHLNRQLYSCFQDVVFILMLKDFICIKYYNKMESYRYGLVLCQLQQSENLIYGYFSLRFFISMDFGVALDLTVDMHKANALKYLQLYY